MAVVKLTRTMRMVLNALAKGEKRPMDLKEELKIPDSTLHTTLKKLEEMGLIEKKVSEKRYALYGLTEKGKEYAELPEKPKPIKSPSLFGFGFEVGETSEVRQLTEAKLISIKVPPDLIQMLVKLIYNKAKSEIQKDIEAKGLGIGVEDIEEILLKFGVTVLLHYDEMLIQAKLKALTEEIEKEREFMKKIILDTLL